MSRAQDLLGAYIAECRSEGQADPIPYLDQVQGAERAELAALIDHFLATTERLAFNANAFERFKAKPRVVDMSRRILRSEPQTLEDLRKQAGVSKREIGEHLARELGIEGSAGETKARYHDIETGSIDPRRVRPKIWESLAAAFGATAAAVRDGAASAFGGALSRPGPGGSFARSDLAAGRHLQVRAAERTEGQRRVDEAFFEPDDD